MPQLSQSALNTLLVELRQGLEGLYGETLSGVYLFGSYARHEADDESDVDLLIVLKSLRSYSSEVAAAGELLARLSLERGVVITPVFASETDWVDGRKFFLSMIRDEAIAA